MTKSRIFSNNVSKCTSSRVCTSIPGKTVTPLPTAARSSDYIRRSEVKIAKSGTNSIAIKTTTGADSTMTSIGVTTIVIEQSANGTSWTPIRTYSSRYTAAMLGHNVISHSYTQTYTGPVNYSYRALVTFYAADKNGSDSFSLYSAVVRL